MNDTPETAASGLDALTPPERNMCVKVREAILAWIRKNNLEPGDRLPPQTKLAKALQAGTHTIHGAMSELVREGIVRRRPGEGTILLRTPDEIAEFPAGDVAALPGADFALPRLSVPIHFILPSTIEQEGETVPPNPFKTRWLLLEALERSLQSAVAQPPLLKTSFWMPDTDILADMQSFPAQAAIVLWNKVHQSAKWRNVCHSLLAFPIPIVHVGSFHFETVSIANQVRTDHFAIGVAAARHLIESGHRRLMMITSAMRFYFETQRREGFGGYAEALQVPTPLFFERGKGVGDDIPWIQVGGDGFAAWRVCPAASRPTAVYCVNDQSAIGFILAARAAGVRVPEDVSVLGTDNFQRLFYEKGIQLTTIDQNFEELARESVCLLARILSLKRKMPLTEIPGTHVLIKPKLILRATTLPRP